MNRTALTLIIASLIGIASIVLHILEWMGVVGVQ